MPDSANFKQQLMIFYAISFGLWFIYVSTSLAFATNDIDKLNKRIKVLEDLLAQKTTS